MYAFRFFRICEISFALQSMDNNLELTTLLNTGKVIKDSEVNTVEKFGDAQIVCECSVGFFECDEIISSLEWI